MFATRFFQRGEQFPIVTGSLLPDNRNRRHFPHASSFWHMHCDLARNKESEKPPTSNVEPHGQARGTIQCARAAES
jgi:hypothetical protein